MSAESTHLVNEFGGTIAKSLRTKNTQIQKHIKHYFDKNSEILLDTGVSNRLVFSNTLDKDKIEEFTGIKTKDIKTTLRKYNLIDPTWRKWNNHTWAFQLVLMIREYSKNKKKAETNATVLYLACGLYSILHAKYFSNFLPNKNIMDYTINNLSNKFYIKKYGNLFKAMQVTAMTSHATYEQSIIDGDDGDLVEYVSQLNSRINAFIKTIFGEYEKNRISKNYINKTAEGREEENYMEVDNSSFQIANISQAVALNLLSNRPRTKELRTAAKMSGVSNKVLQQAIENLMDKKDKEIEEFITLILQIFIIDGKNDAKYIATFKFVQQTVAIYSKSNINNPRVLRIKEILDEWLNESSAKYVQTERIATKSAFRKAMFQYFVFSTQSVFLKR